VQQTSEKALVEGILAHERDACVQLIREYHGPIFRLLFHLCRNEHRAEDLTQETFASAWVGLRDFGGASSLGTWLHRIAYRKFLDSERRQRPAADSTVVAEFECADDGSPDPVTIAIADENSRQLYEALSKLGAEERDVVVLHCLQGLSYEEIAEVVGVPAGTLRWRKSRAIECLRGLLRKKLEYEC
jgi:RNA polymerase sigma-70 factor (ECF subfamily)